MATRSTLLSTFNHVVLPPELPGKADAQSDTVEKELICRLMAAVTVMKTKSEDDLLSTWQMIENTLKTSSLSNEDGICNKSVLIREFKKLSPENALILRVREQNAGLLIRRER